MVLKDKIDKIRNNDRTKDLICNLLFLVTYLIIIIIITNNGKFILASTTDFEIQHYVIPEYFRTLFYSTFDFFPNFAFNLGAGENIYYLSYYGLFNPIILISYLFPMIEMLDYIIFAMSIVVIGSTSLFYFYLRKNNYSHLVSFLCAFIFLCSAPLIFHSHRHIMFISYMPFLIMGFYGIDDFIIKKKSSLLILAVVLMIFTSYYFSISGLVVLFILGIFKYMKLENYRFKEVISFSAKLIGRFIISILISSILILPTLYTLFNGRTSSVNSLEILDLFEPNMYMLYDTYSMGLTFICLIATIYMFFTKRKENKILSIILILVSIFPIFSYIFNIFLYINAKVLIPFIPLVLINVSEFFSLIFNKVKRKDFIIIYVVVSSLIVCIDCNLEDKLISKDAVDLKLNEKYNQYVNNIIENDNLYRINSSFVDRSHINKVFNSKEYKTTMYSSTFNGNYQNSYNSLFNNALLHRNKFMISSSNNILFQIYMGEKYIITKENYNYIYEKIDGDESISIYKNEYVLPIGYATTEIINESEFDKLTYPSSIFNMLGRVIVDEETSTTDVIKIEDSQLNYYIDSFENVEYKKTNYGYEVDAKKRAKISLKLEEDISNKLVIISFDILENVSCTESDLVIQINDVKNKLACKEWKYFNENSNFSYTIVPNYGNNLEINFAKGKYKIGNIKVSLLDFELIENINQKIDSFMIDKDKTSGDNIVGDIKVRDDSYFTLSIPYDKGFNIFVDGEKVDYFKVNKSFIGFKISKGEHNIEISYKAPYRDFSIIISLVGIIIYFCVFKYETRCKS